MLFLLKSEFCPFSKTKHDRQSCVYAHNWQDFKRPYDTLLKSKNCSSWDFKKEINYYKDGCKTGENCDFCHGWKESEYHLENYKK